MPVACLAILTAVISLGVSAPAVASASRPAASWKLLPDTMADERWAPASCLLPGSEKALIAGGYSYAKRGCVASISLFDTASGRLYKSQARLPYPADFVLAAPLPDGTALLASGFNDVWGSMDAAAIYDPARDICEPLTGRMLERRELAQATPLDNGSVLITGGLNLDKGTTLADAEVYDPRSRVFRATSAPMLGDRFGHAACRMADGRVLIVGGTHWDLRKRDARILASAEIYDPASGSFHPCAGSLIAARDRPTATLLPDGTILIAGGQGVAGAPIPFAELFHPESEQFTRIAGDPLTPRMAHSAVSLANGDVLLCGGWDAAAKSTTTTAVLYDFKAHRFLAAPPLPFGTHDLALLSLPNGSVLAAGGKIAHGSFSGSSSQAALLTIQEDRP